MRMDEVPVGQTVFLLERLGDEMRETFYERISERVYVRRAVVQGEMLPDDGACPWESGRESYRPRYASFDARGTYYPLAPALPVRPLSESQFWKFTGGQS
jgi:hypothetical protein